MGKQVTLDLPDDIYQKAEQFARLANQDLASVLTESLNLFVPDVPSNETLERITELTDQEVLALTEIQMEPNQDAQLSLLLDRQQAGTLTGQDQQELQILLQIYQEKLLRKATALSEAVKHGLIQPLSE